VISAAPCPSLSSQSLGQFRPSLCILGLVHVFGVLAEFERNLIKERTQAGLVAACARGKKGGRPKALSVKQVGIARDLYEKHHPIAEICRTLKVSKATLYRSIKTGDRGQQLGSIA
jgi:DNA invertase Pin-like site-specific DNA recombinase